jgi:hypothetical protein
MVSSLELVLGIVLGRLDTADVSILLGRVVALGK